ncbi:hypothetical protein Cadr_000009771 [Camelus dromedarius]|uniref:Uncharacterized protein n=1 Tax=Camelus dromedarius TaxID=9838 RepID=A0A5N4DKE7_CAMDR|nr:hypothetical protein Cadr_000009771 [Camelus dromedarius]
MWNLLGVISGEREDLCFSSRTSQLQACSGPPGLLCGVGGESWPHPQAGTGGGKEQVKVYVLSPSACRGAGLPRGPGLPCAAGRRGVGMCAGPESLPPLLRSQGPGGSPHHRGHSLTHAGVRVLPGTGGGDKPLFLSYAAGLAGEPPCVSTAGGQAQGRSAGARPGASLKCVSCRRVPCLPGCSLADQWAAAFSPPSPSWRRARGPCSSCGDGAADAGPAARGRSGPQHLSVTVGLLQLIAIRSSARVGLGHSGLSAVTQRSQACGDSCLGLEEVGRVADRWSSALLGWGKGAIGSFWPGWGSVVLGLFSMLVAGPSVQGPQCESVWGKQSHRCGSFCRAYASGPPGSAAPAPLQNAFSLNGVSSHIRVSQRPAHLNTAGLPCPFLWALSSGGRPLQLRSAVSQWAFLLSPFLTPPPTSPWEPTEVVDKGGGAVALGWVWGGGGYNALPPYVRVLGLIDATECPFAAFQSCFVHLWARSICRYIVLSHRGGLSVNHRQSMRTGGHVTLGSEVQQRRVGGLGDFSHNRWS